MLQSHQIEELVAVVSSLDHSTLLDYFETYRANFPVDFTQDYLSRLSLDRLRHIFVAMCLQSQRLPDAICSAA
jgi:hypothetical protein